MVLFHNDKHFFNITDTDIDNNKNNKYLNSIDPDINYNCNDICNYTINTEGIKNSKDELLKFFLMLRILKVMIVNSSSEFFMLSVLIV